MELLKNKFAVVGIVLTLGLVYLIATGNMGGAKKATGNYIQIRQSGGSSSDIEVRPNPMQQMIEYNKQQKNK